MKQVSISKHRQSERGSAGVKLVIAGIILFLIGHAGYQYIPVAYQAANFKQDMKATVVQGIAMPKSHGKPIDIVKGNLNKDSITHKLPANTFIDVKQKGDLITARVYYKQVVPLLPFGLYNYDYVFDHSATPSGFLTQ